MFVHSKRLIYQLSKYSNTISLRNTSFPVLVHILFTHHLLLSIHLASFRSFLHPKGYRDRKTYLFLIMTIAIYLWLFHLYIKWTKIDDRYTHIVIPYSCGRFLSNFVWQVKKLTSWHWFEITRSRNATDNVIWHNSIRAQHILDM